VRLGEISAQSQAPNSLAQGGDEFQSFMVMFQEPGDVMLGQVPEVVAIRNTHSSHGFAQVGKLADRLR
jgi:hypothetical protein